MPPVPPELPPMKSGSASTSPPSTSPSSAPAPRPEITVTKRLRQIVTAVTGGGISLILVISAAQLTLRPGIRPTDVMATIEAQTELGVMNQKLGHEPGEHVLTEAQYQETIAHAQREGQTKAELDFQRELAVVQADKERLVGAYTTLYQRANIIAKGAVQMESVAQQFRQQLLGMSNGGRATVIGLKDIFCGLGSEEACQSAREDRRTMVTEDDELSRGELGKRVRELMEGVEDPATLVTHEDRHRHDTPDLPRD